MSGRFRFTAGLYVDADAPSPGFLTLTNYFATQFKTGAAPAINQDLLVLWARPHPKNAVATADGLGAPSNFQLVSALFDSHLMRRH